MVWKPSSVGRISWRHITPRSAAPDCTMRLTSSISGKSSSSSTKVSEARVVLDRREHLIGVASSLEQRVENRLVVAIDELYPEHALGALFADFAQAFPFVELEPTRASDSSRSPAGVSTGFRPVRLNSASPRSASRLATCVLTADCAFRSTRAAPENDPASAAATKAWSRVWCA
jgi:hypothetical protein